MAKINKTPEEWRKQLTPEQFRVLRAKGTETPMSGEYYHFNKNGVFICAACKNPLFDSNTKFDSGSGWPSFTKPIEKSGVLERQDLSHNKQRTEVLCSQCESHLGHVFADGPEPAGLRYCINSVALNFETKK